MALVDSGSDVNLICKSKFETLTIDEWNRIGTTFCGVGSAQFTTIGQFFTKIGIDGEEYDTTFHIVDDGVLPVDVILGKELINKTITIITPESITMRKFLPDGGVFSVMKYDSAIELNHIREKDVAKQIEKMIIGYSPHRGDNKTDIEMRIVLNSEEQVHQKPRRLSPRESEVVRKQIDEWLEKSIIRKSNSNYASPVVLATKKDGSLRLCVDYRKLNKLVIRDRYPLPLIEEQIDHLQGAKYFTSLDLKNGFFHVPIAEESIKYTAFVVPDGQYEFLKVPFGLCNSPAVFQRFINNIFGELCRQKVVCIYMDDLIVPSKTTQEGVISLSKVLDLAARNGLEINWKKCQFLNTKILFLGYEIEEGHVRPGEEKVKAIVKFPIPKTTKQVQSFLGLTGYFRKFVKDFAQLAKPLSDLLRKDTLFAMGAVQIEAFKKLKSNLTCQPILKLYDSRAETEVHTDACKIGLGAILLQRSSSDQFFHPVFYYSRKTSSCEERYDSYQLEVLAIVRALGKFRVYLLGLKFRIVTDCAAFKATMEKKEINARIAGWALRLQEFDYVLEHRSNNRMRHVDALSRNPVVMLVNDGVIIRVRAAQRDDRDLAPIFELLKKGAYENYIINNGVLFKSMQGALCLVVPRRMQAEVIRSRHEQGHFSVKKTEELVRREFFIPRLTEKIKLCIQNCIPCILSERKRGLQDGFLRPIPKGDVPFVTYHIDHLGQLCETTKLYGYILCVVDGFSKFTWLYPTKTTTSREIIQKLEVQSAIFGNPKCIVSDKGAGFTSAEFSQYCIAEKIEHITTTTGVHTGNGQAERINEIIIPVLTKISLSKPAEWYKNVTKLQRFINNTFQRSIGMAPFELVMGVKMRSAEDWRLKEIMEEEMAKQFCDERTDLRENARQSILKIQEENKRSYNRRRKVATKYNLGDMVAIKKTQFNNAGKLAGKYHGPYEVIRVNGRDRYEVRKVGDQGGPKLTSTAAQYMKRYFEGFSDVESDGENGESFPETESEQDGRVE